MNALKTPYFRASSKLYCWDFNFEYGTLFDDDIERNIVSRRVDTLGRRNRTAGYAWCAAKKAFYSEQAASMLVVDYYLLGSSFEKVLPLIYQFIREPPFAHALNKLQFDTHEIDANLGVTGLHTLRDKVALMSRMCILPPDLCANYVNMIFWLDGVNGRVNEITNQK